MEKKKDLHTKSNMGFSLITVILAVALVGILVMLVAYMVLANFRMKMSGLKEKDAFYTAERALEEIRTGLQEDVAEAMSEAYTNVMESYNESTTRTDISLDAQRQAAYEKLFLNILRTRLKGSETRDGYYDMAKIRNYVDLEKESSFDTQKEVLIVTNPNGMIPQMTVDSAKKQIVIKNIKVIYVDAKGQAAVIRTDIQLGVPDIQFPTPSTLPDLMNMIVVADKGIYCKTGSATGDSTGDNEIQGSIYAGILPAEKLQQSGITGVTDTSIYLAAGRNLNFLKGERAVCAGEVTLAKGSTFNSAAETALWAQGVNVSSATANLLGRTYLADDLTIKPGTGSYVKLSGEYYGYGDTESALRSRNRVEYGYGSSADYAQTTKTYAKKSASALSSAITINGKNTTLDLSGLERLMLAGKNYIASKALSTTGVPGSGTSSNGNRDDVLTGESLTVKGTQLAYLVPDSLLQKGSDSYHNPMSYDKYMEAAGITETDDAATVKEKIKIFAKEAVKMNTVAKTLGNKTLSQIGVDTDEPIKTVFYSDGSSDGGGFVYFYLNFTNEKKASEFMQNYYNNNPSLKEAMNGYLSFYFSGESSGISMKNPSAYLRYVVGGNILSYNGSTKTGRLDSGTDEETSSSVMDEETGYQNMWYALKRKMIGSYDLLKNNVKDSEGIAHNETDVDRSVFDNLVNEKEMVQFIKKHESETKNLIYTFTASEENDGLQTIMAHNGVSSTFSVKEDSGSSSETGNTQINTREVTVSGSNKELVITDSMAKKLRLVVCTGDVKIESGVTFYGIIMAKGTITLEPGAKLISSPLDAAKAFQSQINADGTSPKDFFWEGDKYVLGNSQSSDDNKNTDKDSSFYHVEDYVNYKNWKKM